MSEAVVKADKTKTFVCPEHGEYTGEPGYYDCLGEKREMPPECPVCKRKTDEENRLEAERAERQRITRKWRSMNIDPLFYNSTLDNFDAGNNDELRRHLETCRAFAENPDGKLVMIGRNGNGKTHLAVSILKKLGGVIYTAFEIGVKLRQSYSGDTKESEVFEELCTVPLLVIDEVEKIKDSEAKQHWVSYVVGKRYNRMLPIIFTGNCHVKKDCTELKKPCPFCLEYHLENDVLSRISEDGVIMKFNSPDYRRKKREMRGK